MALISSRMATRVRRMGIGSLIQARLPKPCLIYTFIAIETALANEYRHHAALANELAGTHYLAKGRKRAAMGYLMEARHHYLHWGALRKVRYFDEIHPGLVPASGMAASDDIRGPATIATTGLGRVRICRCNSSTFRCCTPCCPCPHIVY